MSSTKPWAISRGRRRNTVMVESVVGEAESAPGRPGEELELGVEEGRELEEEQGLQGRGTRRQGS